MFLLCALAATGQVPTAPEPFRPAYHFSPARNWTNDPNGLVYFEGEYHLFFQYNPFGDQWGHMSWGHAVSRDLLQWRELPVALPEENGVMIFSGSAVVDRHNTTGFCKSNRGCLVAIYTGHTPGAGSRPALQTQNLAYSNDNGRTWTKFQGNPVLDLHLADFRDPKVIWDGHSQSWLMALALPKEHRVRFYRSPDLKQWTRLSEFGPAGATGGDWECPELYELPVDGNPAVTRWVLKVGLNPGHIAGGSGEQYFIGAFDGTAFHSETSGAQWLDYGRDCYCALSYSGLPPGENLAMIGWMSNWQYANKIPTSPWRGQMTLPRRLSLYSGANGIRMRQEPVQTVRALREAHLHIAGKDLATANRELEKARTFDHTYEIDSTIAPGQARQAGWKLLSGNGQYTLVTYDRGAHQIRVDRSHSGATGFSPRFSGVTSAPLELQDGKLRLHIFVDRLSVETFAGNGAVVLTNLVFPEPSATGVELFANGGALDRVDADLWRLRPAR